MKNIHILPTNKPSKLFKDDFGKLIYSINIDQEQNHFEAQNIYITSDEEIKEGVDQWYLDKVLNEPYNSGGAQYSSKQDVIIITTDQDLIKDGVQAIDDEFLEWFVKNPSCEEVETNVEFIQTPDNLKDGFYYKIIIPQEESKQKRMYSDMEEYSAFVLKSYKEGLPLLLAKEWFNQFKKEDKK
jgi:hypothetical protein